MKHVFTYGSLMFSEVWRHVVSQEYASTEARILGYERRGINGEQYPAVVKQRGKLAGNANVKGRLYKNVSAKDIAALDAFEGKQYQRVKVAAFLENAGVVDAQVYVWRSRYKSRLSSSGWDPEEFERYGLRIFRRHYRGF